jgi:hypothetical protein
MRDASKAATAGRSTAKVENPLGGARDPNRSAAVGGEVVPGGPAAPAAPARPPGREVALDDPAPGGGVHAPPGAGDGQHA